MIPYPAYFMEKYMGDTMIDELHVADLALISQATVEPAPGLTVLTGETGAGKSALLSAVKLLVGERATGDQVRDGSSELSVEGRFFIAAGAEAYPDGHIAQRRVTSEGRSRCMLDGALATVSQLAETIGSTVDLCGQHDHQQLLSPAHHLPLLDAWAGEALDAAHSAYLAAWDARAEAAAELEHIRSVRGEGAARVEDARFALRRIDEVAPQEGEYEDLEAQLPRLEHAGALADHANAAYEALHDEGGVLDMLSAALGELDAVSSYDPALERIASSMREATYPLEDAASDLRRYRDDIDFDPDALERASARMGQLVGLMRSFGPRMEDVFARRDEARELVALVDDSEEAERRAQAALDAAEARLHEAAAALTQAREDAAPRFAACVNEQMDRLEMGGAELLVEMMPLERERWNRSGAERIEFLYRPGPGLAPRPFVRIASGGEVSRVMLAIKVVLGVHDEVETLVFDEIDSGVGGTTARAVADVLADLARQRQVIVVTHLAQIAVLAQRHYVVSKEAAGTDGRPETRIDLVEGEDRVREIARMLSGEESASSLEHARTLLAQAAERTR